jgi:hypothetical protein
MSVIFEIEQKRTELLRSISGINSHRRKIIAISGFFNFLLSLDKKSLIYTYILEFIQDYTRSLSGYTAFYNDPKNSEALLKQAHNIASMNIPDEYKRELSVSSIRLREEINLLYRILNGESGGILTGNHIHFPVLDMGDSGDFKGIIEDIIIDIKRSAEKDEIIIIPSETEIEKRLLDQIRISLKEAVRYIRKYTSKVSGFHKVVIQFDKRIGFYIGNSMGAALTIGLIEKLIELYNIPYKLKINDNVVFTGGINEKGELLKIADNITHKMDIVFFSNTEIFSIPQEDYKEADKRLQELLLNYPARKIKLLPVGNIDDILDRRCIVNFRKKNIAERGVRNLRQNWAVYTLILLFTGTLYSFGIIDLDDNPALLEIRGEFIHVMNKNRKDLWSRKIILNDDISPNNWVNIMGLNILDVDNDDKNEVFLCYENMDNTEQGRIASFNYDGQLRWDYLFSDSVATLKDGNIPGEFSSNIIDILAEEGRYILYGTALHNPNYASAVFKLDASTGQRLPGTLWNAGHLHNGYIEDFDKDGNKELVISCINNGYESCAFFKINIKNISGIAQLPSTQQYNFINMDTANYNNYIIIPKTDFSRYHNMRSNHPVRVGFMYEKSKSKFYYCIGEGEINSGASLIYYFDPNLENFTVETGDKLRVLRDSLVVRGALEYPLTDTKEYRDTLINRIISVKRTN